MRYLIAPVLLMSVSCSSLYTREKLKDPKVLSEHIDDRIEFHGEASIYKKNKPKVLGIVGLNCGHIIQNQLVSQGTKYGLGKVTTTTRTFSAEVNDQNLSSVCNLMEETFARNLEGLGYTVKRTAEMKQFPSYSKNGSPVNGVETSGIVRTIVAANGNNFMTSLSSFNNDEEWAMGLAKEAGVDALVWGMASSSWGLMGPSEDKGLKGVQFRVDPKTMFYLIVPYDRCKAAGGCSGWVKHNGLIATTQDFDYTTTLFLPTVDTEEGQQKTVEAWTKYADEQAFLLSMHMTKFEQQMND